MDIYRWGIILGTALIPTIGYTIYIRNIEKFMPEEWRWVGLGYLWGAITAIPFIYILAKMFSGEYLREHEYHEVSSSFETIIFICVILPLIGELSKGLGMLKVRNKVDEVEDGLIHGATIGLGFAAVANIFYLHYNFEWDYQILALMVISSISTALLHGSSSAVTGYGVARKWVSGESLSLVVYFFAGVLIHALFNAFSLANFIFKDTFGFTYYILGLLIIVVVSNIVFRTIRARMHKLIEILDQETEMARRRRLRRQRV